MKYTQMLSPTEIEISESVALGNSMKEIATQRFRSIETIKTHVKNICFKWNARGIVDITRIYTIENSSKFKLLIVGIFLGVQGFLITPDSDAQLRNAKPQRTVRVQRTRKKQ